MSQSDEEFVRGVWKPVYRYQSLSGVSMIQFGSHSLQTWEEAAAYTRERLEQIRQVEEEVELIEGGLKEILPTSTLDALERILVREQAALADLKRGMKQ